MANINRKNAIAFTINQRNYLNFDGLSPELAKLAYHGFKYPDLWNIQLQNKSLSLQEMSWAEYGFTFAHVFKDNNQHFFKAGATIKYLQGIQSAYMFVNDLNFNFHHKDTLSIANSSINYGHSESANTSEFHLSNFGFDIGGVYEWRPDYMKYQYNPDGKGTVWRRDENKYKLKIGVSITDIGSVKFKKGGNGNDFTANVTNWNLKALDFDNINDFDDTLNNRFQSSPSGKSSYRMNLPTAISAQIDYHLHKDFYLNLTPFIAFQYKKNDSKVHDFSSITFTPRWDHRWFGVFVPVQYNFLDGARTGLALRVGPLVVGTTNLLPVLGQKNMIGADAYALLKIPIPYKKVRDRDNDGVKDKEDKCPDIAGIAEFNGCPDKDGDKIIDSEDKCPDLAGVKALQGCPDYDEDGITDKEDSCPDLAGTKEMNGCPDKDGDKITDEKDACPDLAGSAEFNGCPDTDGDKVPDNEDKCPTVVGLPELFGCPDKDVNNMMNIAGNLLYGENPSKALANKVVTIKNEDGTVVEKTTTNQFGAFAFRNLPVDKNYSLFIDDSDLTEDVKIILTNKSGKEVKVMRSGKDGRFVFNLLSVDKVALKDINLDDVDLIMELKGYLYDQDKKPLSNAKVALYHKGNIVESIITEDNGKFNFKKLATDKSYSFDIEDEEKKFASVNKILVADTKGNIYRVIRRNKTGKFKFELLEVDKYSFGTFSVEDPWLEVLEMKNKQQKEAITIVESLTYPSNSFKIDPAGMKVLDKVIGVLNSNPNLAIEINSHTDARSSDAFNLKLSQKRAQEAVKYITSKGISSDRLKAIGHGETKLVNDCGNNKKCSDEEHAKNRRTEFKVIELAK